MHLGCGFCCHGDRNHESGVCVCDRKVDKVCMVSAIRLRF